ncbi:hypothetical protein BS47DRAFT_1394912 [Hydnum rufescens UP504]|uniref:Kinesin-like protein n=1 Tax=Hydnum rufescens UP504 TaxID=1448309 RepID=A0A9P6ATI4_9AGAM|nr:hypothetical protein BS47DRAFT_1394912 [Hydnum rufescens UP504]
MPPKTALYGPRDPVVVARKVITRSERSWPRRATRTAKGASTTAGAASITAPQTSSRTRAVATASEITAKRLRPLADRNGTAAAKPAKPIDKNPVDMLAATKKALRPVTTRKQEDREPIKAYLRVRPDLSNEGSSSLPYLSLISPSEAQMAPPTTLAPGMTNSRISTLAARRQTFSFTQVFAPETSQSTFFTNTTLPLIKDLLNGESGLIFAYGVTNSGKTYTIQGKNNPEEAGILPRALDVVFNSIQDLQDTSDDPTVQDGSGSGPTPTVEVEDQFLRSILPDSEQGEWLDRDETVVPIDREYNYKIFISYVEIYNNQIFDLLGSSDPASNVNAGLMPSQSSQHIPSSTSAARGSFLPSSLSSLNILSWIGNSSASTRPGSSSTTRPGLTPSQSTSNLNPHAPSTTGANANPGLTTTLIRRALPLRTNPATGQKYIHAQTSLRVRSAADAKAIDPTVVESAKLSVVDLAGSERNKNTQATGERMGEANKINSSLMVLGQCMRILRSNQKKLSKTTRGDRAIRTEIPPYRLSRLTEMFQEFFEGHGRAVMIVNVNPFDTGYHENSAVMEFAALASEVSTVTTKPVPPPRVTTAKNAGPGDTTMTADQDTRKAPTVRQVRVSLAGMQGTVPVERVFEIIEEAEEHGEDADPSDDEEEDTLVARLFEELETMRARWYDAEIRCALIEAETRESVMQEMEERMRLMERMHTQRLRREVEENELKMDRKIEMLSRTGAFDRDDDQEETDEEQSEMDDVEASLLLDDDRDPTASPTPALKDGFLVDLHRTGPSAQSKPSVGSVAPPASGRSLGVAIPSISDLPALAAEEPEDSESEGSGDSEDDDDDDDEASDEEWLPTSRISQDIEQEHDHARAPDSASAEEGGMRRSTETEARGISALNVLTALDPNESVDEPAIVPNRKAQKQAENNIGEGGKYVPDVGEPATIKKKKRNLGGAKGSVLTEDDILQVTAKVESGGTRKSGSVRRMDRATKQ